MSTAVHITSHGAQINFGDLPPYLTYGVPPPWAELSAQFTLFGLGCDTRVLLKLRCPKKGSNISMLDDSDALLSFLTFSFSLLSHWRFASLTFLLQASLRTCLQVLKLSFRKSHCLLASFFLVLKPLKTDWILVAASSKLGSVRSKPRIIEYYS